jgi:hypothetical protein
LYGCQNCLVRMLCETALDCWDVWIRRRMETTLRHFAANGQSQ